MFKHIFSLTSRLVSPLVNSSSKNLLQNVPRPNCIASVSPRSISTLLSQNYGGHQLLQNSAVQHETNRTVTKYSWGKGKRKSVKAVLKRFYRLHWGIWIRTRCGRHKKIWRKTAARRRRLRQHVFCNATQSTLLDKMVGKYWTKPKYYVDDPYEPYHTREEFTFSATKPRPYIPPEER